MTNCTEKIRKVDLSDKKILITGATSGIGKEVTKYLAKRDAKLILHGHSPEKRKQLEEELSKEVKGKDYEFYLSDFSNLEDLKRFIRQIKIENQKLDVLINNAGAFFRKTRTTTWGIEKTMAINFFAPAFLSLSIKKLLKNSKDPKIVNVSSGAHKGTKLDFDGIESDKWGGWRAYQQSKLAIIMFTYAYNRKIKSIKINALHPGFVPGTSLFRIIPKPIKKLLGLLKYTPIAKNSKQASKTIIYLATQPNLKISGKYFVDCEPKKSSKHSYKKEDQEKLWELTQKKLNKKIKNKEGLN